MQPIMDGIYNNPQSIRLLCLSNSSPLPSSHSFVGDPGTDWFSLVSFEAF
eukprot:m.20682 g.20682  ORF g.20682 m.20682 type:complete len:50 (+) comp5273_c0_seq1:3507-3656(+)